MDNEPRVIEICTNDEYIVRRLLGDGLADLDGPASNAWVDRMIDLVEAAGYETVLARGRRALLDQWNGARFASRGMGWGCWGALDQAAIEFLNDCQGKAVEHARSLLTTSAADESDA
jgi:hypothetical protein